MRIATLLFSQSSGPGDRLAILADAIESVSADVWVTPAGWLNAGSKKPDTLFDTLQSRICPLLRNSVGCVGVDGRNSRDQLGVVLSRKGIIAIGRKFYPASAEAHVRVVAAPDHLSAENGKPRIFEHGGARFYIAVCNDVFGLPHLWLENPGVDAVLAPVHGFCRRGEGPSGDSDFARKGLAGASKQWGCPVFAGAVFFQRDIPEAWPSGVMWDKGEMSVKKWRYADNALKPIVEVSFELAEAASSVRVFRFKPSSR